MWCWFGFDEAAMLENLMNIELFRSRNAAMLINLMSIVLFRFTSAAMTRIYNLGSVLFCLICLIECVVSFNVVV